MQDKSFPQLNYSIPASYWIISYFLSFAAHGDLQFLKINLSKIDTGLLALLKEPDSEISSLGRNIGTTLVKTI